MAPDQKEIAMTISLTLAKLGIEIPTGTAQVVLDIRRNHTGDTKLWHDLRCIHMPYVYSLYADLEATIEQLSPLDNAGTHDQLLDEDVLVAAGDLSKDGVHGSLCAAVKVCEQSVLYLQGAHDLLAGLFKGTMRDATEESLSRSLKGARAQLAKLEQVRSEYELPKRPHEIRRNALSYLVISCDKILSGLKDLQKACVGADSSDLLADFAQGLAELAQLKTQFELLRERSSQKMESNLQDCRDKLEGTIRRFEAVTREAGRRTGR
jgi:hypothetical protein